MVGGKWLSQSRCRLSIWSLREAIDASELFRRISIRYRS